MEPARKISPQPWMTQPETVAVLRAMTAGGAVARFVGGCVRDALVGQPVQDVDIATDAPPERVMTLLRDADIRAIPTGIEHGTVTAVAGEARFEITTLRHDVETFGRRARVAFTDDWAADAARRDFTMNAIFCDSDGTLYDPTGGLADLDAGRVRFVGVALERIREDVLRLLRFFRFHGYYGKGAVDEEALAACRAMAPDIGTLSVERVWQELKRLLLAPDPAAVLDLMAAWNVLPFLLPEARDRSRLARLTRIEGDAAVEPDPVRRLAALIDTDAAGAAVLAGRLRLSNAETAKLQALVAPSARPGIGLGDRQNRLDLYRLGRGIFSDLVLLGQASDEERRDAEWRDLLFLPDRAPVPDFPLSGRDVLARGVPTGGRVGALLGTIEQWWIDADFVPDREDCLASLDKLIRESGPNPSSRS